MIKQGMWTIKKSTVYFWLLVTLIAISGSLAFAQEPNKYNIEMLPMVPTAACQSGFGIYLMRPAIPDECLTVPTREGPDGTLEIIPHDEHMEILRNKLEQDQIEFSKKMNREAREAKQKMDANIIYIDGKPYTK